MEINTVVEALEPLAGDLLDTNLWAILRWMARAVGGVRSVKDCDATGRLYRVSAALAKRV
jgi:hypothetical protein